MNYKHNVRCMMNPSKKMDQAKNFEELCKKCDYPGGLTNDVFYNRYSSKFDKYPRAGKHKQNKTFKQHNCSMFGKVPYGVINNNAHCHNVKYTHTPQDFTQYHMKFI